MRSLSAIANRFRELHAPPEWGIEPVPKERRSLVFKDFAVLWGDLGIGLLVMLAGTFLVPGLGLGAALIAILIGTALGCLLLALIGVIGSDSGEPTMVLLRPLLGLRGSFLPTALNALQLIGWTIFEFIVMGVAANTICLRLFGFSSYALWTAVFAVVVVLMGIGGPIGFVRQWLEKFAVWIALGTGVWLSYHLLTTYDLPSLIGRAGDGSLPFWQGVDLVIALPISWLPLVADYNRFARKASGAFWGTAIGFFITSSWFLAMGAFLMLGANVKQEPKDFATVIALIAGWGSLLILLADETHNAWADLYSTAVSLQNVFPKARQRWLILGLGAVCLIAALALDVTKYQGFLYIVGSFFIPLFGILAADYFIVRRRGRPGRGGKAWALVVWVVGIATYHVTSPSTLASIFPRWTDLVPRGLAGIGGSIPSFILPFLIYALLAPKIRKDTSSMEARV
ncbi:MAG: putative hydroxymethylpyrimidine transporter CytX [Rectinemataceae bacterium]|jgi:putative hydroxymethylpyrimidine transporter CytX